MKDIMAGITLIAAGYVFVFLVGIIGKMIWGL